MGSHRIGANPAVARFAAGSAPMAILSAMGSADLPTGTVTFLFTDIEGSTRRLQELGEGYRRLQEDHDAISAPCHRRWWRDDGAYRRGFLLCRVPDGNGRSRSGGIGPARTQRARVARRTAQGADGDTHGRRDTRWRGLPRARRAPGGSHLRCRAWRPVARLRVDSRAGRSQPCPRASRCVISGMHRLKDLIHPEHIFQAVIDGLDSEFPALRSLGAHPNNLPPQTQFLRRALGRDRKGRGVAVRERAW